MGGAGKEIQEGKSGRRQKKRMSYIDFNSQTHIGGPVRITMRVEREEHPLIFGEANGRIRNLR